MSLSLLAGRTVELTTAAVTGCLNVFDWRQIFSLDYIVVKTQTFLSSHGGFQHYRETI